MSGLQITYEGCPLCGSVSTLLGVANCTKYANWHQALPDTLEWMRCSGCSHVHTRHYWSEVGLAEVFRNAHANQLAGGTASPDAKRAIWVPVVENMIRVLGGYQRCFAGTPPVWVDVGCGDGALIMTAADYGFTSVGLDARQETVSRIQHSVFVLSRVTS